MRQVLSPMKEETLLDYAEFRLTPTRTRCELVVAAGGIEEKLVSGLLQPYCSHLQAVQEQVAQGGYSIVLDPRKENGDDKEATWFTKGTMERFVRFVSTPEVLERVSIIDYELMKLEEALSIQSQDNPQFDSKNEILDSSSPPAGGNTWHGLPGDRTQTNYAKSRSVAADVNTFDTVENARYGLLRAMETRKYVLLKEQGMAFARATAAGFSTDHISDLICFADCFGAGRLREACIKYIALNKKKQEAGIWFEDIDLTNAEALPANSDNGHGILGTAKATAETWSDIHSEGGGFKLDEVHGNGSFYNGISHLPENRSAHGLNGGPGTLRNGPSHYNGATDAAFSGFPHESLPGLPGDMSSMAYSSPFQRNAQNQMYSGSHSTEFAGNMHMDSDPMNHRYLVKGFVPQLGSNGYYMRGNPQEINQYISQVSPEEQSQGLAGGYHTHPGMIHASDWVNMPASHRQLFMHHPHFAAGNPENYEELQARWSGNHGGLITSELKVGQNSDNSPQFHSHDMTQSYASLPSAKNGHFNSGSPSGRPDESTSDGSQSRAGMSDANVTGQYESAVATSNAESTTYKKTSSKRLQVGGASGRRSGVVLIKNINFITSTSQNDSPSATSAHKNTESDDNYGDDDGDADRESVPEKTVEESKFVKQNEDVAVSNQDAMNGYFGRQDTDNEPNKFYSFESEAFCEAPVRGKPKDSAYKDPELLFNGDYEPQTNIVPGTGYLQEMKSSESRTRTLTPDSEMMLPPRRESSLTSQRVEASTEIPLPRDGHELASQSIDKTSDSFILPEFRGLQKPASLGDKLVTECTEKITMTRTDEVTVANDSFIVPGRSLPIRQSNGSLESTFSMEAEFPVDEQKNASSERKEKYNVDSLESFDDLILLPKRNLSCDSVRTPWVNPLDSEVNLLGGVNKSNESSNLNMEQKSEEINERISSESSPKKVTKTTAPTGKKENLARRKSFPATRADKSSTKSAGSAPRNSITWNSKLTIPLKTKKEKEEEERKRLEDLKMQRLERISARSNSSGPSKSAASKSRVPKPPSPVGSPPRTDKFGSSHAKGTTTSPSTSSKKSSHTTLGHAT